MKKKSTSSMMSRLSDAYGIGSARVFVALTLALSPVMAWAEDPDGGGGTFDATGERVCGFFNNINQILDAVSVVVVTLAVIIAGYQIAFAHKRIADVAPVLIGGCLIGIASQVASMLIGSTKTGAEECTVMLMQAVQSMYA